MSLELGPALERAKQQQERFLSELKTIVNIDSGTYTKPGVDQVAQWMQGRLEASECHVTVQQQKEYGNHLVATRRGSGKARILVIGHMDTVFPDGEVQRRPFTVKDGRAYGPGILDMKSGLLLGLHALDLLRAESLENFASITFLCNSDEEIGSPSSKPLVRELASQSDVALVLEPGRELDEVVTSRKGVGNYRLEVRGVSAHAGVEPHKGRSAILELAHKIVALQALNGTIPGVTVNVGVVGGGERPNVVPDHAHGVIDMRAADRPGIAAVEEAFKKIAAQVTVPDTHTTITGQLAHLPFEATSGNQALFKLAQAEAARQNIALKGISTGGGSDGNTTATLIPTLDALGVAGGLAHNPGEYIVVDSIAPRMVLLAGLLARIGDTFLEGGLQLP
ncbi:MAG TPA: M20 family metallopeptidase [Ktedonobacterales bacterium]|jgi:glutamate carboxypeptidase